MTKPSTFYTFSKKKSKRKIATPKEEMDLVEVRLKRAGKEYKEVFGGD